MSTPTTEAIGHPTWCSQGDTCGPEMTNDELIIHDGYPERIEFEETYATGTDFQLEVQRFFHPSSEPGRFPEEVGFNLRTWWSDAETGGYAILSTDRLRELARFLEAQADQLDAWSRNRSSK